VSSALLVKTPARAPKFRHFAVLGWFNIKPHENRYVLSSGVLLCNLVVLEQVLAFAGHSFLSCVLRYDTILSGRVSL
jgi:hypothetical protein